MKKIISLFIIGGFCSQLLAQPAYEQEIKGWYANRTKELQSLASPLSLEGMYWLQPGDNYFGGTGSNGFAFPINGLPTKAGNYIVTNDSVELVLEPSAGVAVLGSTKVSLKEIPTQDSLKYKSDKQRSIVVSKGVYKWFVTYNAGRLAVRFLNGSSDAHKVFSKLDIYPVNAKYRFKGIYHPPAQKTISITNVVGFKSDQKLAGHVWVDIEGEEYKLDALVRDDKLFIVFSDSTADKGSYPFKFLYAKLPAPGSNEVVLDFNQSTNPNCAFTPHAECPLPTANNIIRTKIPAGEKKYQAKKV